GAIRPIHERRPALVRGSLLPGLSRCVGLRRVLPATAADQLRFIPDGYGGVCHTARLYAARGPRLAAALLALPAENHAGAESDELQQHQSGFREHLPDARQDFHDAGAYAPARI